MAVTVVGSLNVDLCVDVARLPAPGETVLGRTLRRSAGGKGLNQAIAAARQGADVAMVGCVGDDSDGRWLRAVLEAEGIDASGVFSEPDGLATGAALITVDAGGASQITVAAGANASLPADHVTAAVGRRAPGPGDVVLTQLETSLEAALAAMVAGRRAGASTILNPAPAAPLPRELVEAVHVLVPNEHEVGVTGLGAAHTIVTLASAGARWHSVAGAVDGADQVVDVAPFDVDVVDSTGAGDAFCGALAAALSDDLPMAEAIIRASAAGALAVIRAGAAPAMPTAAEVDALLRQSP